MSTTTFKNLSEFDSDYIEKILNGESFEDFRFYAECERCSGRVLGLFNVYSDEMDYVECYFENPEYGKVDIVPIDYPIHGKRRTYISDVYSMFKPRYDGTPCFIRKEDFLNKCSYHTERNYISRGAYVDLQVLEFQL